METLMTVSEVVVDDFLDIPEDEPELVKIEPSREHVWLGGYWDRDPGCWRWTPGRWEVPPHKDARWVKGHWKWQEGRWHWYRGHWAVNGRSGYVVDEPVDIPAAIEEKMAECPSEEHYRVKGCWEWDGSWRWRPGRWSRKPHPRAKWVAGQWEPFGTVSWRWIEGHWKMF